MTELTAKQEDDLLEEHREMMADNHRKYMDFLEEQYIAGDL